MGNEFRATQARRSGTQQQVPPPQGWLVGSTSSPELNVYRTTDLCTWRRRSVSLEYRARARSLAPTCTSTIPIDAPNSHRSSIDATCLPQAAHTLTRSLARDILLALHYTTLLYSTLLERRRPWNTVRALAPTANSTHLISTQLNSTQIAATCLLQAARATLRRALHSHSPSNNSHFLHPPSCQPCHA